jgi:hypothetical protein
MKQEVYMSRVKVLVTAAAFVFAVSALGSVPTTLNDFFLPGSQPNQSGQLETPDKCDNCHGGYNQAVEPAFNWRGSMMAQAARDPFFYACMAISNQDAPDAGDLCIRCHSMAGWLEGRSSPTDGSALNNNDRQGVQCDFCHKLVKPTPLGVNPYPNDPAYTSGTYPQDQSYLSLLNPIPSHSANGMYIADANNAKRGPFADAEARHQFFYSPFHRDASLCGTCHDVSNPVYTKDSNGNYVPNTFDQASPSFDPYTMFPIERTFSEWKMSAYNSPGGVYAPQFGGNKTYVSTCQDCHLKDVTGVGCNKPGAPTRTDLPLHDMTGGNTFIPLLIPSLYPGEVDTAALNAGIQRATGMLQKAVSLMLTVTPQGSDYSATVKVTNETGHKLPSGYPEGRRIWINLKAYDTLGILIYESGAYDLASGILTHDPNIKVYEIKPGISADLAPTLGLPVGPSFHFVLNNHIYQDNRIPPRGFTNAGFATIQSAPVGYTYADGQYWDLTDYVVPGATARVVATLYYQTTSKEYVEFLRDENRTNQWGQTFYNLWAGNGKSAPVAMATDTVELQPITTNNPPVLATIGAKSVNEGQLLSFRIWATDPDTTIPTLSIVNKPTGAVFSDSGNGAGSLVWTPTFAQAGVYPVTFKASDGSLADSEIVQITVNNVNRPPVLAAIGAKSVNEGQTLSFQVTATDPDGTPVALSVPNPPTNAVFVDSGGGKGGFVFNPDFNQATVYNVTFLASDGILSDTEVVSVTVNNVNRPPVLDSIEPQFVAVENSLSIRVSATDPDGTTPTLSAVNLPVNSVFEDSGNGSAGFIFAPQAPQVGDFYVTFMASDGFLDDTLKVLISVTAATCVAMPGDANASGTYTLGDVISIVNYIFNKDGCTVKPLCWLTNLLCRGDWNGSGTVSLSDVIQGVNFIFNKPGGPWSPLPTGVCCQPAP